MDNYLDSNAATEILRSCGVQGTKNDLHDIVDRCDSHQLALERVGGFLREFADGQAQRIRDPDVLEALINDLSNSDAPWPALSFYSGRYQPTLGGYPKLGLHHGDFQRGVRVTSALKQADFSTVPDRRRFLVDNPEIGLPTVRHDLALFLADLGQTAQAEALLREAAFDPQVHYDMRHKSIYQFVARQNLCDVLVLRGRLREAERIADVVIETYESDDVYSEWGGQFSEAFFLTLCAGEYVTLGHSGANPYAIRAVARALQGKTREALIDFKRAEDFRQRELEKFRARRHSHEALVRHKQSGEPLPDDWDKPSRQPTPLTGYAAMYCAMLLTRLGKLNTALKILRYVRRRSMYFLHKWPRMAACADVATSDVYRLMGQHEDARHALEYPLTWARETGQQEIVCWARLSEARLELAQNRLDEAQRALDEASTVAQGCEFKLYEADCMVTAGRIALIRGDVETAATMSSQALHMAGDPDCAYAWAQGNALHLLGEVVLRGGDRERANRLLQGAARLRARIEDPRLANTQEILAQMPDATQGE